MLLALALAAANSNAAVPEGPRLAFTRWPLRHGPLSIITSNPIAAAERMIVRGTAKRLPMPLGAPNWSPDGSALAFTGVVRLPGKRSNAPPPVKLFLVAADGSGLHAVPGTRGGYEPIFSPDGKTLAFTRIRRRWRKNATAVRTSSTGARPPG